MENFRLSIKLTMNSKRAIARKTTPQSTPAQLDLLSIYVLIVAVKSTVGVFFSFVHFDVVVITNLFSATEFDCLGHWDGPDNQKYLALLDKQSVKDGKPQYRCAVTRRFTISTLTSCLLYF